MDDLVPAFIAARIWEVGARVDALAVVAVDHPLVNEAVEEIIAKGKPVFTLLSDVTSPVRACYIGVDSRKAGRTAAWAISRLATRPEKLASFWAVIAISARKPPRSVFGATCAKTPPSFRFWSRW